MRLFAMPGRCMMRRGGQAQAGTSWLESLPLDDMMTCMQGLPLPAPELFSEPRRVGPGTDSWGFGAVAGLCLGLGAVRVWSNETGNTRAVIKLPQALSWESKDLVATCLHRRGREGARPGRSWGGRHATMRQLCHALFPSSPRSLPSQRPTPAALLSHAAFDICRPRSALARLAPCLAPRVRRDPQERVPVKINATICRNLTDQGEGAREERGSTSGHGGSSGRTDRARA